MKIDDPYNLPRTVNDIYRQFFSNSKNSNKESKEMIEHWNLNEKSFKPNILLQSDIKWNQNEKRLKK